MNEVIEKVAGILIRNNKLLLVSSDSRPFYWTPGGKIQEGETPIVALKRELKEELNIKLNNFQPYIEYISDVEEDGTVRRVFNFILNFAGNIEPHGEIDRITWLSRADFEQNKIPLQIGVKAKLIPKLIEDNFL